MGLGRVYSRQGVVGKDEAAEAGDAGRTRPGGEGWGGWRESLRGRAGRVGMGPGGEGKVGAARVEVSGPAPGNHCRLLLALGPRRWSRRGDAAVRVVRRLAGRPTTAIEMCYMSGGQRRERIPGRLVREIIIASIRRLIDGHLTLHS